MKSTNIMLALDYAANTHRTVAISLVIVLIAILACASVADASTAEGVQGSEAATTVPLAQGGPDEFGYTYKDSNEPGGPAYAWQEISGTGTLITNWTSYDDGFAGPIPIGFAFNYYGVDFTELFAGSNGYSTFGQGTGVIPPSTLPGTSDPNNDIALFGGDMYLDNYGTEARVYYQTLANPTRFVLEYVNLHYCCDSNTAHTFEMVLYPSGDVQAQYKTLNATTTSYVGIENQVGNDGLSYSPGLADNLAVRYDYPRGVFLTPVTQSGYGQPGTVITYTLELTNQTGAADSFDLAVQPGNAWLTTLTLTQTGVLTDGASLLFDARVDIPAGATPGDTEQAIIAASSVTSPTVVTDTAQFSTTAIGGEVAYVALAQSNLVALVDTSLHTVLGTVNVGPAGCTFPWRATIAPNGGEVYVSCYNSDAVVVIDTTSNVVAGVITGVYRPDGIAFTRDGAFAMVGSRSNYQIAVIDTKTHAVTTLPAPSVTRSIATHPYRNLAYVASGDGTVLVVDTTSFVVIATIPAVSDPWDIAVSPDGLWVFTGSRQGGGLAVIDTLDNSLHTVISGLGSLTGVEVAPDGSVVYAAALEAGVHVIDTASFQLVDTINNVGSAWELAATCQGSELWVGNSSGSVPVIDTSALAVTDTMAMPGSGVKGIAICPQLVMQDVLLVPPQQTQTGALGALVTHELTVINATGRTDTFRVNLSPSVWPATLSASTIGPLADGQTATVEVVVTIPDSALWHQTDTVDVAVTTLGVPSFNASAHVTTEANAPPVISTVPTAMASTQLVNQTVNQVFSIRNGNGVTLTVDIEDIDLTPNMVVVAPLDLLQADDVFPRNPAATADDRPIAPPEPAQGPVPRVLAVGNQPSTEIQAGGYYTTTIDNEDNNRTGNPDYDMDTGICGGYSIEPIEFNIFIDRLPGLLNNVLTIRAYDVELPNEVDEVRINGVYLGNLAGAEETWSETSFTVPAGGIVIGANLVEIDVTNSGWCATIDWGELFVTSEPAAWLHETPQSATILTNSSQDVTVTFDSTGLQPKEYLGAVVLTSNDPVQPSLRVPVTMTVNPAPDTGQVSGAISDALTGQPLTATVELLGVATMVARPNYRIWATAGTYALVVSAAGYVSVTLPVAITTGGITTQDVALEPARVRMEWDPLAVVVGVVPGGIARSTVVISSTGPIDLDVAMFEVNLDTLVRIPSPSDLSGKRILYDRSHGEPSLADYSTLVDDAVSAGAVIDQNWYFPIDADVYKRQLPGPKVQPPTLRGRG